MYADTHAVKQLFEHKNMKHQLHRQTLVANHVDWLGQKPINFIDITWLRLLTCPEFRGSAKWHTTHRVLWMVHEKVTAGFAEAGTTCPCSGCKVFWITCYSTSVLSRLHSERISRLQGADGKWTMGNQKCWSPWTNVSLCRRLLK